MTTPLAGVKSPFGVLPPTAVPSTVVQWTDTDAELGRLRLTENTNWVSPVLPSFMVTSLIVILGSASSS